MSSALRTGRSYCLGSQWTAGCGTQRYLSRLRIASSWESAGLSACVWFAVVAVVLCVLIEPAAAEEPGKNVLVLHNWAYLPQSWTLMQSTVRARVPGQVNFYNASVENP